MSGHTTPDQRLSSAQGTSGKSLWVSCHKGPCASRREPDMWPLPHLDSGGR